MTEVLLEEAATGMIFTFQLTPMMCQPLLPEAPMIPAT